MSLLSLGKVVCHSAFECSLLTVLYCLCDPASCQVSAGNRITDFDGRKPFTELQIRGNIEDTCNLKIFFLISQQKHML